MVSVVVDILHYQINQLIMHRPANKYARYAKSVTIKTSANGLSPVHLTAIYKGNFCDDEKVTITLTEKGQTHTFPEKTEYISAQYGCWTTTMPIHTIKGTIYNFKGDGKCFELKPMESCNDVVDNIAFTLEHDGKDVDMMKGLIDESMTSLFAPSLITKDADPMFFVCKSN